MSPLETDRFLAIMRASFRSYIDEFWGPYRGPGGPHMRSSPDPEPWRLAHPWRELGVAYEAAKLADAFELAVEGTGVSYMKRFADDPEFLCGTRPPGWPRPRKRTSGSSSQRFSARPLISSPRAWGTRRSPAQLASSVGA